MPYKQDVLTQLLQDHVTARRVMAALEYEVDRVAQFHRPHAAAIAGAVYFLGGYMKDRHHPIEDMIYSALNREAPQLAAEIKKIADEHDETGALVSQVTEVAADLFADPDRARIAFCRVARSLIAFERHHLRREESKFFTYAVEQLTPATWRDIGLTAKGLEKNLAAADRDEAGRDEDAEPTVIRESSPRSRRRGMDLHR